MKRRTVLGGLAATPAAAGIIDHQAAATTAAQPAAPKPPTALVTVPAVQQWTPRRGNHQFKRPDVVVQGSNAELSRVARTFAEDVGDLTGERVRVSTGGRASTGDIVLRLGDQKKGPESYRIDVDRSIVVTGTTPRAVFNGTRTVLQWLRQTSRIPAGTVIDWPVKEVRSLLVDNTPRHFSLEWWENMFKTMAWFKLNDTNLYVDGVGITLDQGRKIDELARKYYVKVVPQINMPAHMHVLLPAHPEFQLVNKDGSKNIVALDLTNPKAVEWALGLLPPWLDAFSGDEWHLGSDEFPGWPGTGADHPQLDAYAKERFGPEATFADLFADYQNQANKLVKSHGKKMRVWNDMIRESKVVTLDTDVTVEYWIQHDALPGLLDAQQVADRGNKLINCHIDRLYYDQSRRNLDPQDIWNEFKADLLPFATTVKPPSAVRGARLCVWLAWIYTPMESDAEVLHNLVPPMQAFAQEVWGSPRPVTEYADFVPLAERVGLPGGWNSDGEHSVQPSPAATPNQDGSLAYFARDAEGVLWTGHQAAKGLMHFSQHRLARDIVGSPAAITGADGRVRAVARERDGDLILAAQKKANSDDYSIRTLRVGAQTDPVVAGNVAVVRARHGLVAIDLLTGATDTIARQPVGEPSVALVGATHHVVSRTRRGLLHAWRGTGKWQSAEGSTVLDRDPVVVNSAGKAVVFGVRGSGLQVSVASTAPSERWAWKVVTSGVAGELFGASNAKQEAHLVFRSLVGDLVHVFGEGEKWTVRKALTQIVDDPTLGFNGAGGVRLFAHTVRQTLRVAAPIAGKDTYDWADLAESQLGQVVAVAGGDGMITWFGAMEYGDLLAGAQWGGGIWDWGRDLVLGTYAYPVDELQPDQFDKVLHNDQFDSNTASKYTVLKPSAGESAPALVVGGGTASVTGSRYFSLVRSNTPVAAGHTAVVVEVDQLLASARDQNTIMVGFVRDEKNYSVMWMGHTGHRIGFDTVSNGRLMPDGGNGNVPFVVMPGDRLAVTLAANWMVAYVERHGVWHRVHAAVATGDDDLRDPKVRAQYHYAFGLRGDQGTIAIGELTARA